MISVEGDEQGCGAYLKGCRLTGAPLVHPFRGVWTAVPVSSLENSADVLRGISRGVVMMEVWCEGCRPEGLPLRWCGEAKDYYAQPPSNGRRLQFEGENHAHQYVLHNLLRDYGWCMVQGAVVYLCLHGNVCSSFTREAFARSPTAASLSASVAGTKFTGQLEFRAIRTRPSCSSCP